jgi:hypothetical protein
MKPENWDRRKAAKDAADTRKYTRIANGEPPNEKFVPCQEIYVTLEHPIVLDGNRVTRLSMDMPNESCALGMMFFVGESTICVPWSEIKSIAQDVKQPRSRWSK